MSWQNRPSNEPQSAIGIPVRQVLKAEDKGILIAALLMMIVGWAALAQLVMSTRPRLGGEIWLFFALLGIAVTGTAIPVFWLLRWKFAAADQYAALPVTVVVRRGIWAGVLAVACAWLMIPRALTLPIALMLLLVLIAIEVFLRSRESANER